jgi:hypothetical protein
MGDMPMAARTAEHDKLNFQVGEWKTREVHNPSPFMPQGGTGEGRATIKWQVGNLVQTNDYHSKGAMAEKFEGFGLTTWDAEKKNYVNYWFDNVMPTGMVMRGHIEAGDLILQGGCETPHGTMQMRIVTHSVSRDEFKMSMSMEMEGKMVPMMTITYARA